jgi:hypothetical protein
MKTIVPVLASIAAISMLTGCVSYRLVERTETGSTYALYTMDRDVPPELKQEVQSACGGPAKVVREGEVPIGETSQTNSTAAHKHGVTYGTTTTDTTQKTEWRVTFQCANAAPAAAPADATAQAAAQ